MGQEVTRVARIALPDGTPVWARISGADELATPSGELSYTDTGFRDRVEASVDSLHSLVTGVARSLAGPLRAVRPDEVSVEFGIELTAKAGKVVGLLADGEAKAGITVTLTWNSGPPDLDAQQPAQPGAWANTPEAAPVPTPGATAATGTGATHPDTTTATGTGTTHPDTATATATGTTHPDTTAAPDATAAPDTHAPTTTAAPDGASVPPQTPPVPRTDASTGAPVHGGAGDASAGGGA
jgi:hypothetical protein